MKPYIIFIVLAICVGVAAWLISTGGCSDPTKDTVDTGGGEARQVSDVEQEADDIEFDLNGENTDIKWTGSNSIGQKPTGFFYDLTGRITANSKSGQLKRLEIEIDMNGVKAMSESLTKKLKHKGFFEVEKFPQATFVSTSVEYEARPGDPNGTNCVVEGNFQLKDVTQSMVIPMEVLVDQNTIKVKSQFSINRKNYGVIYSDAIGDKLIRDSVLVELSIDSLTDNSSDEEVVSSESPDQSVTAVPLENYTEQIKSTLVEFDMILVPGDEAAGKMPFHIGKTEVTWNEFDYWALCKNMPDKDSIEEISMQLRPSAPHDLEKTYRGWGRDNQPVVGVSRLSAELYCKWLSKRNW